MVVSAAASPNALGYVLSPSPRSGAAALRAGSAPPPTQPRARATCTRHMRQPHFRTYRPGDAGGAAWAWLGSHALRRGSPPSCPRPNFSVERQLLPSLHDLHASRPSVPQLRLHRSPSPVPLRRLARPPPVSSG
ncbi:hypothetical protein T440DRAFT_125708 [Plenodomus tracheiphilus IPT5]|uniref:Uncharacterized protein n=1 Tax=Plenodomus tracheiphilus IPT5 TaxID=1408161 RepID=A0A6A7B3K2_9PLEO|nr:hypothetical protein T440DRAFT_125708 [Plenodomus tracheiphilus IPT5]